MPEFFSFTQGTESNARFAAASDASPLLGRFRAVPAPSHRRRGSNPLLTSSAGGRGSVHVGYGALLARELDDAAADEESSSSGSDSEVDGDGQVQRAGSWARKRRRGLQRTGRRFVRWLCDVWISPRQSAVRKAVNSWWCRWVYLVVLPASLAVAWCALPFPQYPLPDDEVPKPDEPPRDGRKIPGHGEARVQVNFWFFLFVYYGFYNFTALIWITKVFNLYSLNWWPKTLGFLLTMCAIAILSLAVPIPLYLIPETKGITVHNTAWITWTFIVMALPVIIAFCILMTNERHLGLRHSLSETQRIFTSSWWAGDPDSLPRREQRGGRRRADPASFDPDAPLHVSDPARRRAGARGRRVGSGALRRRWLPASFVRFVWFCLALLIGLLAYVIGEAYAELYLRTLPHNNLETIVYVYGWIATVYLLDGLTAWILGGNEGERVGSYPLSWVFKLYFTLTYQTYVRALYARLRSPQQFILLQILSSTSLIILTPVLMSATVHRLFTALGVTDQSYGAYQKLCARNVFIRFVAENASMLAFLGSVVVLHFGPNKDVYPFFAFDRASDPDRDYDFALTFYASAVTWACELAASLVVAGLIRLCFGVRVVAEGCLDLAVWPELLPTAVAVVLHVLQNMLFSIVRLQFR